MNKPRPISVLGMTPDEAAAAWVVRVEDGPLSPADQAAFDAWKAESPTNVAAYARAEAAWRLFDDPPGRSEEHTSELQSLMRISYAVFCLQKKKKTHIHSHSTSLEPNRLTKANI